MSVKSFPKTFNLHKNVILQDPTSKHQFRENYVVLPLAVIEEIYHPFVDNQSNELSHLIEHFKGERLYSNINLEKGEWLKLAKLTSDIL